MAALIIAAGLTWYFASPAWTLHQMKAAADAGDVDALDSYIDYPALREDLKAEIMGQMEAEATKDRSGFDRLGLAIGTAIAGPMVDGIVSPAGVRAALTAQHDSRQTTAATPVSSALHLPDDPVIVRRGFSEFIVATKRQPTNGLVFRRHGLSWKLIGVDLPVNQMTLLHSRLSPSTKRIVGRCARQTAFSA